MPKFAISESVEISKPLSEVFAYVRDFQNWPAWSPWLICEHDAKVDFRGDAYSWEGEFVGSGEMQVLTAREDRDILYALEFFKPWKSKANVQMSFKEEGAGTKVTWTMQSGLPWFMFFLKKMMVQLIKMDYQRGLKMLKEQLETGEVDSELSYAEESLKSVPYVAIEGYCKMEDMEKELGSDFQTLMGIYREIGDHSQPPFSIYKKWKLRKGEVQYLVCCPVKAGTETPNGCVAGVREGCSAFVVTHTGAYHHLGNAWSAGMMRSMGKNRLFKKDKKIAPFEIYLTDPDREPDTPIITKVCLPKI